jgi:hypothetical protein
MTMSEAYVDAPKHNVTGGTTGMCGQAPSNPAVTGCATPYSTSEGAMFHRANVAG